MPVLPSAGKTSTIHNVVLTLISRTAKVHSCEMATALLQTLAKLKSSKVLVSGTSSRAVAAHKTHTTELAYVRGYKRAYSRCPELRQLLLSQHDGLRL
jgi:hypothetical protein